MKKSLVFSVLLALAGSQVMANDGCCPTPCCPPTKKICVGKVETKKVSKTYYDCACVDFCLPKCGFSFGLGKGHGKDCGCCQPCAQPCDSMCANCEKPRTKKVLIKKTRTVEECETKCDVQHVLCETRCCPSPCGTVIHYGQPMLLQGQPAPKLEQAPMPAPKK